MTDVSRRRREVGTPTPGRFAPEGKTPGTVTLPAAPATAEPLTLKELEWAQQVHGTSGADSSPGYYETMQKVFAAARSGAVEPEADRTERALAECAEECGADTGLSGAEILNFYDAVKWDRPGTEEWEQSTRQWAEEFLQIPVDRCRDADTRMRAVDPDGILGAPAAAGTFRAPESVPSPEPSPEKPSPSQSPEAHRVLAEAAGTLRDPLSIPRTEAMTSPGFVEVVLDADDVREALERHGYDTGEMDLDGYDEIYADATLTGSDTLDIWGVKDGAETSLATDLRDEQLVNPDTSEYLNYRGSYTDPVPAHSEAVRQWGAQRLDAANALLDEAGITVEVDPSHSRDIMLRRGDRTMRVIDDVHRMGGAPLIETRNWRKASDDDVNEFLGGDPGTDIRPTLTLSARLAAAEKLRLTYKENR